MKERGGGEEGSRTKTTFPLPNSDGCDLAEADSCKHHITDFLMAFVTAVIFQRLISLNLFPIKI